MLLLFFGQIKKFNKLLPDRPAFPHVIRREQLQEQRLLP